MLRAKRNDPFPKPTNEQKILTPDFKEGGRSIAEYERYHQKIWPEITKSIEDAGVVHLDIHRVGTRKFTVLEVNEQFCFEAQAKGDLANPKGPRMGGVDVEVLEGAPNSRLGEKWLPVERTFRLEE